MPSQFRRIALGSPNDVLGSDDSVGGPDTARMDLDSTGALEDGAAETLNRNRQSTRQLGGVDGRTIRSERGSVDLRRVQTLAGFIGLEPDEFVRSQPPTSGLVDLRDRSGALCLVARERDRPATLHLSRDLLLGDDTFDFANAGRICVSSANAEARSEDFARLWSDFGKSAEAQPPLRPEAPKPAYSASSRTTLSVGSALSR